MHPHSIKGLWDLPQLKIVATEKVNQHTARVTETPTTTVARIVRAWKKKEASWILKACQDNVYHCQILVLGLDDFAILKGHVYRFA